MDQGRLARGNKGQRLHSFRQDIREGARKALVRNQDRTRRPGDIPEALITQFVSTVWSSFGHLPALIWL